MSWLPSGKAWPLTFPLPIFICNDFEVDAFLVKGVGCGRCSVAKGSPETLCSRVNSLLYCPPFSVSFKQWTSRPHPAFTWSSEHPPVSKLSSGAFSHSWRFVVLKFHYSRKICLVSSRYVIVFLIPICNQVRVTSIETLGRTFICEWQSLYIYILIFSYYCDEQRERPVLVAEPESSTPPIHHTV